MATKSKVSPWNVLGWIIVGSITLSAVGSVFRAPRGSNAFARNHRGSKK